MTCDALLRLCNREAVELTIDGGATMVVAAGKARWIGFSEWPVERINRVPESLKAKLVPPLKAIFQGFRQHLKAKEAAGHGKGVGPRG